MPNSFTDTSILQDLIGDREHCLAFLSEGQEEECMEFESQRHDDEWAKSIIKKYIQAESGTELQKLDRVQRNEILRKLKEEGVTVRQLERLTGINRGVIQKA